MVGRQRYVKTLITRNLSFFDMTAYCIKTYGFTGYLSAYKGGAIKLLPYLCPPIQLMNCIFCVKPSVFRRHSKL